ncbi:AP2 domain-containing protein [Cryptosporidium serpentis]
MGDSVKNTCALVLPVKKDREDDETFDFLDVDEEELVYDVQKAVSPTSSRSLDTTDLHGINNVLNTMPNTFPYFGHPLLLPQNQNLINLVAVCVSAPPPYTTGLPQNNPFFASHGVNEHVNFVPITPTPLFYFGLAEDNSQNCLRAPNSGHDYDTFEVERAGASEAGYSNNISGSADSFQNQTVYGGINLRNKTSRATLKKGQGVTCEKKNRWQLADPQFKSGYKGVSWNSRMEAWLAFFVENGVRKSKTFSSRKLGFNRAREKAIKYLDARRKGIILSTPSPLSPSKGMSDRIPSQKRPEELLLEAVGRAFEDEHEQDKQINEDTKSYSESNGNIKMNDYDYTPKSSASTFVDSVQSTPTTR